jgi:glycosyltransferase involved in cell wall biosynthesis
MKISVLLDNYNYELFVGRAIESVLQQTYKDFEVVIVDDGSTDGSREIIAKYNDARIRTVFKENGGQGSAFKTGLAEAHGEYIAFLDSDDLWEPGKLARCVEVMREHPDVVLINHGFRLIDASGTMLEQTHVIQKTGFYDLVADMQAGNVDFSLVATSFFVGRRKECLAVDFDDREWRISADTPLSVGLALRGPVFNLPDLLGSYRVHGNNLWHGRYDEEALFKHYRGVYDMVNTELARQRRAERVKFSDSDFAIGRLIATRSRYSVTGFYSRLRRLWRRMMKKSGS